MTSCRKQPTGIKSREKTPKTLTFQLTLHHYAVTPQTSSAFFRGDFHRRGAVGRGEQLDAAFGANDYCLFWSLRLRACIFNFSRICCVPTLSRNTLPATFFLHHCAHMLHSMGLTVGFTLDIPHFHRYLDVLLIPALIQVDFVDIFPLPGHDQASTRKCHVSIFRVMHQSVFPLFRQILLRFWLISQ